jgi:catechol 2,3-dioxygenase-like lactoylglutathione lyase family enzyme
MERGLGFHRQTVLKLALLESGPGARIELFECAAPDQRRAHSQVTDVGGAHIAISVSDLDSAIAEVASARGVTMLAGPTNEKGGVRWIYLRTPWGLTLELVERRSRAGGSN